MGYCRAAGVIKMGGRFVSGLVHTLFEGYFVLNFSKQNTFVYLMIL